MHNTHPPILISMAGLAAACLVAACATGGPATPDASGTYKATTQMSGAQLYQLHCARCHVRRFPEERTDAQWQTVLLHMRMRASLPGATAREILKFLQASNPEGARP